MIRNLFFLLTIFAAESLHAQQDCDFIRSHTEELIAERLAVSGKEALNRFERFVGDQKACFKQHEITRLYTEAIQMATQKNDPWLTSHLMYHRILNGYTDVVSLSDTTAFSIERMDADLFRKMEKASDSVFIARMQANPHLKVNFELAFQLRSMVKADERAKFSAIRAGKDGNNADSLWKIVAKIDSLNEVLLRKIFEEYGYSGYNLVGTEGNSASLLMLHMSTDFQVKYVGLLQDAVEKQQLVTNIEFLIDKILYKSDKNTLYGTDWSKFCPVETDKVRRKELLLYLGLNRKIKLFSLLSGAGLRCEHRL